MSASESPAPTRPPWETCLDVEGQDAGHYLDGFNEGLYRAIGGGEPGRVLEIGCAAGMFGKTLKERHPGTHVTGIEASRAAADVAATRIDRVIRERMEELDFAAHGIAPASFDLIVAGDVLEHLHNPWGTLSRLRPLIAPGGRLVTSLPNVRNLEVLGPLAVNGRFEYAERGLLDITHLRFFTLQEMQLMFDATGYRTDAFLYTLSRSLEKLFRENEGLVNVTLNVGRMSITSVTQRELMEFCSAQFAFRLSPR